MLEQVCLMLCGYFATMLLAREMGPEKFGLYGILISVLVWMERTGRFGVPNAVARLISEGREQVQRVEQTAFMVSLIVYFAIFLIFWITAPTLARLFHIPAGTTLFRLAALDIPFYGMYFLYRGVGMGRRAFGTLSAAGVLYALTKLAGIISLVWLGLSISGALIVNIIGSFVGLLVLILRIPIKPMSLDSALVGTILRLALPLALSASSLEILHYLDLWSLKVLMPDGAASVGIYVAAGHLAKAPELVLVAVPSVLFPSISRALADNDLPLAQRYVQGAVRFLWVGLLPIAVLVAIEAEHIMTFLFSTRYTGGGPILTLLIFAYSCLAKRDTSQWRFLS
jgi:O-antigen/teichoic acid export membrane protein